MPNYEQDEEGFVIKSVMNKWKKPMPLDFVEAATSRWSFPNWQSGNEDSIYYNINMTKFFKTCMALPPKETKVLERNLNPELLDLAFYHEGEGKETCQLRDWLKGPKQVQCMMMMHKGKVVFETYPGMNPDGMHIWMSAGKTTVGLSMLLLWEDGKVDFEETVGKYMPELKGTHWDPMPVKALMNMCSGMDCEETFVNLMNPNTVIFKLFLAVFDHKGDWREIAKTAQPLKDTPPNTKFQYSGMNTMLLVLIVQSVSGMSFEDFFYERVWSKIGVELPHIFSMCKDGTPVAAGCNATKPEDFLKFACIFTPAWQTVTLGDKPIVSEKVLKKMYDLGDPKCYPGSTEADYGYKWFGHMPDKNSAQWDHVFADGAMFKHGNMGQGIYVDSAREFCGIYHGLASNDESITGPDHSPGYLRAAAKKLAGF